MTSPIKKEWLEMKHMKDLPSKFALPQRINNEELVLVTRSSGLCKYNIRSNKWTPKWISYPSTIKKIYTPRPCFDPIHNILYIYDSYGQLFKIHTLTKHINILNGLQKIPYPRIIYTKCNDKLHIIGGQYNNIHYIFDETAQKCIPHHEFEEYEYGLAGFGIIYIESERKLILIGGIKWEFAEFSDDIYSYNISSNQWIKFNHLKIPSKMSRFGYCMTQDEGYILLCGGFEDFEDIDNIYVIETETKTKKGFQIKESDIKCPKQSKDFHAITMIDQIKDELIVFGFVRYLFKSKIFETIQFPPFYIIKLINNWYCNEYLHLFEQTSPSLNHWTISVDVIISSTK